MGNRKRKRKGEGEKDGLYMLPPRTIILSTANITTKTQHNPERKSPIICWRVFLEHTNNEAAERVCRDVCCQECVGDHIH